MLKLHGSKHSLLSYAVAIALAWVNITASLLINLVLACFYAIPPHVAARAAPARQAYVNLEAERRTQESPSF